MSALNIKHPKAHQLANAIALRRGESITQAVILALENQLRKEESKGSERTLIDSAMAIVDRVSRMPVLDRRSDDEILGYNRHGAFDPD